MVDRSLSPNGAVLETPCLIHRPKNSFCAKTNFPWKFLQIPSAGSMYSKSGAMINWHSFLVRFNAGKGNMRALHTVDCNAVHISALERCPSFIFPTHSIAISLIFCACCLLFPSGAKWILNFCSATFVSMRLKVSRSPVMLRTVICPGHSDIFLYAQFPPEKSTRYQKVLLGTMAPLVAARLPSQLS